VSLSSSSIPSEVETLALVAQAHTLLRRQAVDLALDREQGIDALDRLDRDRRLVDSSQVKELALEQFQPLSANRIFVELESRDSSTRAHARARISSAGLSLSPLPWPGTVPTWTWGQPASVARLTSRNAIRGYAVGACPRTRCTRGILTDMRHFCVALPKL
jgi:hypothetical protein